MRRRDRAAGLLEEAEPWDLVVLDETHHARRRSAGAAKEGGPNALLDLMRSLKERTQGLVLMTATPMQVHPIEVWDLLNLLGLPPEWTADAFLRFFDDLDHPSPPPEAMERLARLFRAVEGDRTKVTADAAERQALAAEERADIERLLARIRGLPPDSKLAALKETLAALREAGYEQAMVFTQYTDTLDFLRDELRKGGALRLICFSGRGGEAPAAGGAWRGIGRDDAKRRFRLGEADVLLCTDAAAAEGLNFQFCGALVNYDLPWNPMRVEQRIGRLDQLGQKHPVIRVVNLHYEGTVETDVYRALRNRIGLFETVVGRLQPILSRLPRAISDVVLGGGGGGGDDRARRTEVVDAIDRQAHAAAAGGGFDIDTVLGEELAMPDRPPPLVTLDDLDRVIASDRLMPPGTETQPMGHREYGLLAPGMKERLRVTTDPAYYEEHAESVELWSPGNPLFQSPDLPGSVDEPPPGTTLRELLER